MSRACADSFSSPFLSFPSSFFAFHDEASQHNPAHNSDFRFDSICALTCRFLNSRFVDSSFARPQSSGSSAAQSDDFCPPLDPTNCYKTDKTRRDSGNANANQNDHQAQAQSAPVQSNVGGALSDQEANDQPAQQQASRRGNMNVQSGIQQHGNGNMNAQTSVQQASSRRSASANLPAALQQMRRSNTNVQYGVQQFGNGNTNMQGNIQQQSSRRGNMNSQTGIQQNGDDNMNAQQSIQQSSQLPEPTSRRGETEEFCPPLDPTNCYKKDKSRRANSSAQKPLPASRRGNMNVQSGIQQTGNNNMNTQQSVQQSSLQSQPSSRRTNSEASPLCGFLDPTGCYKEKSGQRSNFNAQSDVQQIGKESVEKFDDCSAFLASFSQIS